MNASEETDFRDHWVGFLMVIVVFIVPYHFTIGRRAITIESIGWRLGSRIIEPEINFQMLGPDIWFHP